eukprot:CAMPEP_0184868400 /NCGR_PEP_ID=MMETSP0580-20130426/30253_1 /TAXON_ID=1118495 /ORGANISM="Dactyliosolen fragilissimus" /LENGTH=1472 /DNA_ID=CAMNT_0027369251 /DNA_START=95 /DNA_END=4513 /DNA_ORIENTATION=-
MADVDVLMSDSDEYSVCDMSSDSEFEHDENLEPSSVVTKPKKGPLSKAKTTAKIAQSKPNDNNSRAMLSEKNLDVNENSKKAPKSAKGQKKTVEQMYQKKSQLEHILLRPDTYIGSVERISQEMYILGPEEGILRKEIQFTPGLFKIFDEILVNAADNKQRDQTMDRLDIEIDAESNEISVKNNGKGIPIAMHKEHKCYVPTLIFGHLLTGSNFDDDEKKTTGGRNGYGAKLANIFSLKFVVECVDSSTGLKFHQVFRDNMSIAENPSVKKCTAAEKKKGDYVKISFSPDLKRFKMQNLDEDTVALLSKRAYDIAGSMANRPGKSLSVTLNKKKLGVRGFKGYLKLYKELSEPAAYEAVGDRWEVGVGVSEGSFEQISFVNAINTSKGGQHVTYIADQVAKKLVAAVNKKNKGGVKITENQMKNHLAVYVNCLIENPAFDSQTKENLTTRKNAFGSECQLSDKFIKDVVKSGVVDRILAFAKFKQNQALKKQGGTKKKKLTGIVKLDDANFAGSAKSSECTLILTEGDSAKSLAMSGLSVVGRDYYGVFPLKGKPLNVREASHKQIMGNDEIKNVVDIMGLKFGTEYDADSIKSLRYGKLMIMADQDHDGSHIKGLVINFIHHFWPSLLKVPGFLQQFITPIVKATKGKKFHTFFTLPEYESWVESTGNNAKGWSVKYYKGLGTSTSAEAKEYFSNLDRHEIHFSNISDDQFRVVPLNFEDNMDEDNNENADSEGYQNNYLPDSITSGSDLIDMAFSKKQVETRKIWLNNFKKGTFLDYSNAQDSGLKYSDFINKELILFSQADNQRSIPHIYDGFKPSQRKVLFACFLKNLKSEMKVAQLCGYVGEKSAYHHGEASLAGTIVGMAQDFVGSNNINLLTPAGQFGTRRMGGKDAASARYIFTKLEKITRAIFHPDDDALLTYLEDDGDSIEPEFYMPVIPMVLVNGSDGIGTGWSTSVPNFNPREIINNLRCLMGGHEMKEMTPWYFGYTGDISADSKKSNSYIVKGRIERINDTSLFISELPLKTWTQNYKGFLEGMLLGDSKKESEPSIKDFKENHTDTTVSFTIDASKEKIDEFERSKDGLEGKFKLTTTLSTANMNMFDEFGRIIKYSSPENVMKKFYSERLKFYSARKDLLLKNLEREKRMLSNKARFVEEVCEGILVVSNRKRKDILSELHERHYELFPKETQKNQVASQEDSDEEDTDDDELLAKFAKGYEYLLGLKIWSLTYEKAEQLRKLLAEKVEAVAKLESTRPVDIWENDLLAIEEALDERDDYFAKAAAVELESQNNHTSKKRNQKKRTVPKKRAVQKASSKQQAKKKEVVNATNQAKEVDEKDSDKETQTLAERMALRLSVSPQPKKQRSLTQTKLKTTSGNKKRNSPRSQGVKESATKSPLAKKNRKVPAKKKIVDDSEESDFDEILMDEPMCEDNADEDVEEIAIPAPRSRSARARKQVTYVLSDSEDSDSDFSEE